MHLKLGMVLQIGVLHVCHLTNYQMINLDASKLKELADDNFIFDEKGRNGSKRVENTVGKGEIARYEQFLLFPQCFQKACFPGASKGVIVWEWVNGFRSVHHLLPDLVQFWTLHLAIAGVYSACTVEEEKLTDFMYLP